MTTFKELGLSAEILKVLEEMGFEKPSKIQEESIPVLLDRETDFIGLAQTGTGKTAAFGLPMLEQVNSDDSYTQALILAPTRELGQQIAREVAKFSKYMKKLNVLAVYGGAPIYDQIKALKKTQHVIIATPGRLIDLIKRKAVKLDKLRYLILDEADEMLNMGFKEELDVILSYTPEEKSTWLFSATMPAQIKRIVNRYMDDPFEVKINAEDKVNTNIDHQFVLLRRDDKSEALCRFLDINPEMRGLVFCRTKRDTQELAEILLKKNYRADALHGDLSQKQRDRVMGRFRNNDLQILIATDVAARGIDVDDLSHVFHFKLPDDNAYYTHRSGRTARAGKKGISMAFVTNKDYFVLRRIEKHLGIKFKKVLIPNTEAITDIRIENWCLDLLETRSRQVDEDILAKAKMLLGNLSKQELVEKLVAQEIANLDLGRGRDLNLEDRPPSKRSGDRKSSSRKFGDRKRSKSRDRDKPRSKGKYRDKSSSKFSDKKKKSGGKKKRY